MTTTPTGSPAWTRAVSHVDYGGDTNKRNYGLIGPVDSQTDISAEEWCRLASDTAAAVRSADFAVFDISISVVAAVVNSVYMMTGVRTVSYNGVTPPTGFPGITRSGTGDITVTFDSSYNDEYGVAGSFAPVMATGTANSATAAIVTTVVSGQTVRVRLFDDGGVAINGRLTLRVS